MDSDPADRPAGTADPASHAGPSLVAWRNAVFTIFTLQGFVFASWASRVPQVRDILHASTAQMGLVLGGLAAGAVLGLLASSHIITALGATRTIRIVYTVATVGLVVAGAVLALAPTLALVVAALAVLGAGTSIVDVAMNLSGAANERAVGRTLLPLFHAAFSFGTVAGAGLGSLLLLLAVPIGVHLVGTGVVAIVTTQLLVRHLRPAEHVEEDGGSGAHAGWRGRLAVWRDPRVLLLGVVVLGMAFAEGSANDWLNLAVVDGYGLTQAGGAAVFAVFVAAMTGGRLLGAPLLDRFARVPVLRASAVLAGVGLLLVVLAPGVPLAVVGVVLWGLGAALGFPVGLSAAADDPRTATAAVSAVATMGYCAFLVGPPVIGFLGDRIGILHALAVVLVLISAAGLASGAARPVAPARG